MHYWYRPLTQGAQNFEISVSKRTHRRVSFHRNGSKHIKWYSVSNLCVVYNNIKATRIANSNVFSHQFELQNWSQIKKFNFVLELVTLALLHYCRPVSLILFETFQKTGWASDKTWLIWLSGQKRKSIWFSSLFQSPEICTSVVIENIAKWGVLRRGVLFLTRTFMNLFAATIWNTFACQKHCYLNVNYFDQKEISVLICKLSTSLS